MTEIEQNNLPENHGHKPIREKKSLIDAPWFFWGVVVVSAIVICIVRSKLFSSTDTTQSNQNTMRRGSTQFGSGRVQRGMSGTGEHMMMGTGEGMPMGSGQRPVFSGEQSSGERRGGPAHLVTE